jgi:glycosyltransferase involved in cell wall biosynthesis
MRIVHINSESAWGGGEAQTRHLICGLQSRGIENTLIAPPGSQIARRIVEEGVRVVELPMHGEWDVAAVVRLTRILRNLRPDVLQLHTSHAHTLGLLAGRLAGVKRIVATRRMDLAIKGPLAALKYRRVDRVVAISEIVRSMLLAAGVPQDRITLIYSAVDCPEPYPQGDLRAELGLDSETLVIGTAATLTRRKGHQYLFDAVRTLKERCPRIRLLVAGNGPKEDELRELAARLGLDKEIVFLGFRRDIPRLLNTLDVFVLASLQEGLGVALLEAACAARPIVATNVGGIPEIVKDGDTGLLVPPADSESLADKIAHLLEHPEQGHCLGGNARALIRDRFSVTTMVESYVRLYEELVGQP